MRRILFFAVLVLMMTACGNKTKGGSATDSLTVDSTTSDAIDRHSETYIRERLDTIYSTIRRQVINDLKGGDSYIQSYFNLDSAYCSSRYYSLLKQALEISDETGEPVFEYDHWVCGQDYSEDWNYQIKKIHHITDSTATAEVNVVNFGHNNDVILSLFFERGDWYVDEFGPKDGEESDQVYFRTFISDGLKIREKAKTLVGEWCWVGDDCPELIVNLKMTDHGLTTEQCDVYRMYGFDNPKVTFDGEQLSLYEEESDEEKMETVRYLNLFLRLDANGDLTGNCSLKHPQGKEYSGPITLRKGYFKYRDEAKPKLSNYAE